MPYSNLVNYRENNPKKLHIIEALEKAAESGPGFFNVLDRKNQENILSFAKVLDAGRRAANFLLNRGVRRGQRIIILLPTSEEFLTSFFGALMAGAVPVPIASPLTFGSLDRYFQNLRNIIANSKCSFFLTNKRIKQSLADNAFAGIEPIEIIDVMDIGDEKRIHGGLPSLDPADAAFIQYTSGTTGAPKGAVISNRAVMHNCNGIKLMMGVSSDAVAVSWLPLFHDMGLVGMLLTGLFLECQIHLMPPESFMMKPLRWLENISRYKGTISTAPNFSYKYCCKRIDDKDIDSLDLSSWKFALNGAEPVCAETVLDFQEKFSSAGFLPNAFLPVYGMAENSLAATFSSIDSPCRVQQIDRTILGSKHIAIAATAGAPAVKVVSVGKPLPGQEISIVGADGEVLEEFHVGKIMIKSPSCMEGYFNNPEETEKVLQGGWLDTGDLGYMSSGRLYITGREKDLIIKMGRNYYPYDIERVAGEAEGVRNGCVAAFSVQNHETGSEDIVIMAETKLKGVDLDAFKKRINASVLAALGVGADFIVPVPPKTIVKTSSGKIKRTDCQKIFWKGLQND